MTTNNDTLVMGLSVKVQLNPEEDCLRSYENFSIAGLHCPTFFDGFSCWPPTDANSTVSKLCSDFEMKSFNDAKAFRICTENGTWLWGNWTNYNECLQEPEPPTVLAHVVCVGSAISLTLLLVTLFIFTYFKSLHCSRLQVHKNLVCALVLHCVFLQLISAPLVYGADWNDWFCKTTIFGELYTSMATINWMFVEGLLLHSRIAVSVFRQETPLKLYYFIGWVSPLVFLSIWTYFTCTSNHGPCWEGYGKSRNIWIITGPMIAVLTVNAVFLVNIIRILVAKLRGNSSMEIVQVSKAAKATALLFPLLGIPHLLFCINPGDNSEFQGMYLIFNGVLQSSQGIFVSILYCFLNSEVQTVLLNAYIREILRRNPNRRYSRGRTLSRTSTTFLSTNDRQRVDSIYPMNK